MKENFLTKLALRFPQLYLLLSAIDTRLGTSILPLPALSRRSFGPRAH
ncbi:hypothetical protein [Beduinella massiliensis]